MKTIINNRNRKFINILLLLGMSFLVALGVASFLQMKKLGNARSWVVHSHRVIEVTYNALVGIHYAESSARAYFVSNQEFYVNNFKNAIKMLDTNLSELEYLTKDNQKQNVRVMHFAQIIYFRITDLNGKMTIVKNHGLTFLLKMPVKTHGEEMTGEIRQMGADIIKTEKNILHVRGHDAGDYAKLTNILIMFFDILGLGLIAIVALLFNQQIIFRHKAEQKLQKSENELYNLAYYDTLTGLANRSMLYLVIERSIAEKNKNGIALLYLDLDNFKNINDSLGHEVGDTLLRVYAEKLKATVAELGVVSRIGGDEFIIVLNNMDKLDNIAMLASKILATVSDPIAVQRHKLFITTSIGISVYPINGADTDTLMKNADIAMYRAKELGKNNYQFCLQEMTASVEERALLVNDLHQAISNNEFSILYQPIVSLKNDSIVAVEALIRWNNPAKGLINPTDFIMLAESNGLIVPIGEWLLQTVCDDMSKWLAMGFNPFKVAVNISTKQFMLGDFVSSVTNIIQKNNFDPGLLEFEITESVLLVNSESNIEALQAIKNLGINIVIDDFGTGYSSLSYLQSLAIDKLKIDQSFVEAINSPNHNPIIIKAIITMAHSLNIKVIAEGVETLSQVDFLKAHHCDEAQGFHYCYPLTATEIVKFVHEKSDIDTF